MNIKAIIGLGNPPPYENSFHSAGFLCAKYIAGERGAKLKYETKTCRVFGLPGGVLALSKTFMNESGAAVSEFVKKEGVSLPLLLVMHDDSDLPLGTFRFSYNRGSAGHRGVESVIKALKTKEFWRLRLGIRPESKGPRLKAGDFVLANIPPSSQKIFQGVFSEIGEIVNFMRKVTPPGSD